MQNLAGTVMAIADAIATEELIRAGIPVFRGKPSTTRLQRREVQTSVVGALQFSDGLVAVLERGSNYWSIKLSVAADQDDCPKTGASGYNIRDNQPPIPTDSQIGLSLFPFFFTERLGKPVDVDLRRAAVLTDCGGDGRPGLSNLQRIDCIRAGATWG